MAAKRRNEGSRRAASRGARNATGGEFQSSPGSVQTALIRGNNFAVKAVQYVVIDGLAIVEGDIVLGTPEEVEQTTEQLRAEMVSGTTEGVILTGPQFRWPNCRVPFTIDAALPNQNRVTEAIAHWQANTRFRFVARTTEANFVTFRAGSGCSSQVGMRGGQQFVNLAPGCDRGRTVHEIGHVVGLWHEQSREDRDLFVRINFAKVIAGMEHNFNQHISDGDDVGPYDFGSIMHYPRDAFSVDGTDTIIPVVALPPGVVMGQRNGLSAGDIAAAGTLCPKGVKEAPKDGIKDLRKDAIKDIPSDTVKEQIKDIRVDTRKEQIFDTLKEQIRDTIKEGTFDPGPTLRENVTLPGRPPIGPRVGPVVGGAQPFAVVTPHQGTPSEGGDAGLQSSIDQLDGQLQQIAEQLAQLEGTRQSLQAQFDETSALLDQLIRQYEQSAG
ncbi:MAG: M12 family metallopeptidase [Vicinamibacterales bacterium]